MIKYLLPLLLLSCTIDQAEPAEAEQQIEEITTPEVVDEVYTLQGIYRRSIGSQWEVYHICDEFIIYIQTGDSLAEIFRGGYSYNDKLLFVNGASFVYSVHPDKIIIEGYEYFRL